MCSAAVVTPWKSGPQPPCHPERSMRIRFTNPHAQSNDPCTSPAPGGLREFSPYRRTRGGKTGKGTSSTRAASAPNQERGFSRRGTRSENTLSSRPEPERQRRRSGGTCCYICHAAADEKKQKRNPTPSKNEGWSTRAFAMICAHGRGLVRKN
jgi:hypothetical protein